MASLLSKRAFAKPLCARPGKATGDRGNTAGAGDSVWGGDRHRNDYSGSVEGEVGVEAASSAWGLGEWLLYRKSEGTLGCRGMRKAGAADQGVSTGMLRADTFSNFFF